MPHEPGQTPDSVNTTAAFSSENVKAEFIWDALDKAGKKCVVLNYPGSWPSNMKNGVVVGGAGLTPGEYRNGLRGLNSKFCVCENQLITTGIYPNAIQGELSPAEGWSNLAEEGEEPLEMEAELNYPEAQAPPAPLTWYVLARQSGDKGYDRITLSPSKDFTEAFCTLEIRQWSPKITTAIQMEDGSVRTVFFRCKLVELSPDAEDFRLFLTALVDLSGLASPKEVLAEIQSNDGVPVPSVGLVEYALGLIDLDTFVECCELHTQWLADAAVCLLKDQDWDLFCMHSHPPDFAYHMLLNDLDPKTSSDEEKRKAVWDAHRRIYESQDRMVADIIKAAGSDTLTVLISDHGAVADGPLMNPYVPLTEAGLSVVKEAGGSKDGGEGWYGELIEGGGQATRAEPSLSKAVPQRVCYVYVNLKGREREGIVEPEDYEKVQQEIIDALYTYVDPRTGTRPVSLALTKRDARILGLHGDNVGDVVYAVYPWFHTQHGPILPTAEWGRGSLKGLFVMNGPGMKAGARLDRTLWLQDLVPTLCYVMNWPVPADVEGAIVYQVLKDPNLRNKQMVKLESGLLRMEAALERKNREPWDKHDCA